MWQIVAQSRREMQLRTEVWDVLTDFASYEQWNPFIARVDGKLAEGQRLELLLTLPDGSEHRVRPTVTRVDPEREVRWVGRLWIPGLLEGEHFFQLEALDGDRTRLRHSEDFRGVLVQLLGRTLTQTGRAFVGMNHALKTRVEEKRKTAP
jgi:hypothetical protein